MMMVMVMRGMPTAISVFLAFHVVIGRLFDNDNRLRLNEDGNLLTNDRDLYVVHDRPAPSYGLCLIRRATRRHAVSDHGSSHCANRSGDGLSVSAANLVADDASRDAANDGTAVVLPCGLNRNLLIPAFLSWTVDNLVFSGKGRQRKNNDEQDA